MNLISLKFFLLFICCYQNVASFDLDEYLENSMIKRLKETHSSFESVIAIKTPDGNEEGMNVLVEESFSFKNNIGEYRFFKGPNARRHLIYLNEAKEMYEMNLKEKGRNCDSIILDQDTIDTYKNLWAPFELVEEAKSLSILGPNFILFTLLDINKKKSNEIKCEDIEGANNPKKCVVTIDEKVRVEYFFYTPDILNTLYQVNVLWQKDNDKWETYNEYTIVKLELIEEISKINLPISFGCKRLNTEKYPQVETNYGVRYKIEHEAYLLFQDKSADYQRALITSRNKMYIDRDDSIVVAERNYEIWPSRSKTFYNTNTEIAYDTIIGENKCLAYHLTQPHNFNWFYYQEILAKKPEFFNVGFYYKANYLGDYDKDETIPSFIEEKEIDNTPTLVFEKVIKNFNKKIEPKESETKNQQILNFFYKNYNQIFSDYAIATYYFAKDETHWTRDPSHTVPLKIKITLFNETQDEAGFLLLYTKAFQSEKKDNRVYLDLEKCAQGILDRTWFTLKFEKVSPDTNVLHFSKYKEQIEEKVRNILVYSITPSRITQIIVDTDGQYIYATALLLDLHHTDSHFVEEVNVTFSSEMKEGFYLKKFRADEEACARTCLARKDCPAYAYHKFIEVGLNCKIYVDDEFEKSFDPNKKDSYDWSRVEIEKLENCSVGRRFVKYNTRYHISMENYLRKIDVKARTKSTTIKIKDVYSKSAEFVLIGVTYKLPDTEW